MTIVGLILTSLALVSAAGAILADHKEKRLLVYILRPLTMVLIILIALRESTPIMPFYRTFIAAGLCASLAGDVFMMLREKRVMAGMACFFVALSLYTWAYSKGIGSSFVFWPLLILVVYAIALTKKLLPNLGRKKIPVILYVAAMTIMVWLAAERYNQIEKSSRLRLIPAPCFF